MIENVDKSISILVVDDHSLTRDMVRVILRQFGFLNISTAENGLRAIERLNETKIDLVICDWNMPSMSGIEVLRAIRSSQKYNDIKFIMLTAEAYRDSVKEAASLHVNAYIAKPFTANQLGEQISAVFDNP